VTITKRHSRAKPVPAKLVLAELVPAKAGSREQRQESIENPIFS